MLKRIVLAPAMLGFHSFDGFRLLPHFFRHARQRAFQLP